MTTRVIKCIETLGFEVLGSKTSFLGVLDCHNSTWRAITRHSEQKGAESVNCSPPTRHGEQLLASPIMLLAMASKWCLLPLLARSGRFGDFRSGSFVQSFINVNPSNQGPKWWSKKAWFLWYEASIKHVSKTWHTRESCHEWGSKLFIKQGKDYGALT